MYDFYTLFLYFFIYSILGWIVETVYCRMLDGKWTNRGFLFGPYCPIYGFGSLLIVSFLGKFESSPILVFLLGMIFTSVLEYLTSYILEKMFNAKWWDYSYRKYNLNGRICLLNSLEFAVLGLAITYIAHPIISSLVTRIPLFTQENLFILIFCVLFIDCCSTVFSLLNLKEKLEMLKEMTEKFKEQGLKNNKKISDSVLYNELKEFRKNFIERFDIQGKRILDAFPKFEFKDFKMQIEEFRSDLLQYQEERKKQKEEAKQLKKRRKKSS